MGAPGGPETIGSRYRGSAGSLYPRPRAERPRRLLLAPTTDGGAADVERLAFGLTPPYLGLRSRELCMRQSPSITPSDRLDRDIYLVLEDFSSGPAWRETDEDRTNYRTVISDFLTGQYDLPLRVVAFNAAEGWSRDASEEVAEELERRVAEGREVSAAVQEFIERFTGRPLGVQMLLPLRKF